MYHVNPKTGEPGTCKAMKSCPFGGLDAHYTSEEAARAAYEKSQEGAFSSPKPRLSRVPAPKTKSEFDAAILKVIPKPEDSTVVPKPKVDTKEASGTIRYVGGAVSNIDANGKYKYQGIKDAVAGVRQSIADARAAGEIPSWITTTVKNSTDHWTSPSLTVTVGFKGPGGKSSIPHNWLDSDGGGRPHSEGGARLAAYMDQLARQYEDYYSNIAIDDRNVSNRGKVAWL